MKRLGIVTAGALLAAAGLVVPAAHATTGDPCTDGGSGLGLGTIPIGDGNSNTIYIDDRDQTSNGTWIYMESNGVFNLQRGDTADVDPLYASGLYKADSDPCVESSNPDTLIQ